MDKIHLKRKAKILKAQKLLIKISIMAIIGIILGIFYIAVISKSNKELINTTLSNFFNEISKNNINYTSAFINSILSYTLSGLFIWILGISIIGIPIILIFLFFKSFILGFSISSLIYFYKLKGIIAAIIYIIPIILSLLVFIILSFFSIRYSKKLVKVIFYKQDYTFKNLTKKYFKILIISETCLIICSIIETFLIPTLLKLL